MDNMCNLAVTTQAS